MNLETFMDTVSSESLEHYGIPKRSGRYPWGSGERPYQGDSIRIKKKRPFGMKSFRMYKKKSVQDIRREKEEAEQKKENEHQRRLSISDRKAKKKMLEDQRKEEIARDKAKISKLTDQELKAKIERIRMEQTYAELMAKQNPKKEVKATGFLNSFGKSSAKIIKDSYENIGTQAVTYGFGYALNAIAGKDIVNPRKGQSRNDKKNDNSNNSNNNSSRSDRSGLRFRVINAVNSSSNNGGNNRQGNTTNQTQNLPDNQSTFNVRRNTGRASDLITNLSSERVSDFINFDITPSPSSYNYDTLFPSRTRREGNNPLNDSSGYETALSFVDLYSNRSIRHDDFLMHYGRYPFGSGESFDLVFQR